MTSAPALRVLEQTSWIEAFCDYTRLIKSPVLFRKWAAIAAVAWALERKVWVRTMGTPFYPNLYTILVGPPGVGKTNILNKVEALWTGLKSHHLAPTSVTKSSFVDHLNEATRIVITPNYKDKPSVSFNALNVI